MFFYVDKSIPMLKQYIRNQDRQPYGCMLALPLHINSLPVVSIGVSVCNTEHDKFDKDIAYNYAYNRALNLNQTYKLCIWPHGCIPPKDVDSENRPHLEYFFSNAYFYTVRNLEELVAWFTRRCVSYYKNRYVFTPKIIFT